MRHTGKGLTVQQMLDAGMGVDPDRVVAARLGCSFQYVHKRRKLHGIAPVWPTTTTTAQNAATERRQPLRGAESDDGRCRKNGNEKAETPA